jgi:hypothetical protein
VFLAGAKYWEFFDTGFRMSEQEQQIVVAEAERRIAEAKAIT